MKKMLSLVLVAAIAGAASVQAQQGPPTPARQEAPKGPAGAWTLSMDIQGTVRELAMDLKVDGAKVTGNLTTPQGVQPFEGKIENGKMTWTLPVAPDVALTFTATHKAADDTLAGSMTTPQGEISFTGKRAK